MDDKIQLLLSHAEKLVDFVCFLNADSENEIWTKLKEVITSSKQELHTELTQNIANTLVFRLWESQCLAVPSQLSWAPLVLVSLLQREYFLTKVPLINNNTQVRWEKVEQ
jgi:hypothetical protein